MRNRTDKVRARGKVGRIELTPKAELAIKRLMKWSKREIRCWRAFSRDGFVGAVATRSDDPACQSSQREFWIAIGRKLTRREALAVRLRFIEGLELTEIGVACGVERSGVGKMLIGVLERLRVV